MGDNIVTLVSQHILLKLKKIILLILTNIEINYLASLSLLSLIVLYKPILSNGQILELKLYIKLNTGV